MAAVITNNISDIGVPVNFQLMEGLLSAARKKLPYFNGTVPGVLEKNGGAVAVKWERIENLTAVTTALSEPTGNLAYGNGRDLVNPTVTRVTATCEKYGSGIALTEEVDLIQMNVRAMRMLETLGANAGESLNEICQTQILAGATALIRYAGGVASAAAIATALAKTDVQWAVNQLNRQSAMKFTGLGFGSRNIDTATIRDAYYGICHPDVEEDIRGHADFNGVEQYGGYTQTLPGEFGTSGGVRWCATEIANITADAATTSANGLRGTSANANDVYDSIIYGREAIGTVGLGEMHAKEIYMMYDRVPTVELISHAPGSSGVGDPFNEIGSLAWKAWFVSQVLNANWVVRLRSAASSL